MSAIRAEGEEAHTVRHGDGLPGGFARSRIDHENLGRLDANRIVADGQPSIVRAERGSDKGFGSGSGKVKGLAGLGVEQRKRSTRCVPLPANHGKSGAIVTERWESEIE